MDFFAQSYPPPYAEYLLRKGIMASQRQLGRITQDGKPQTLVQEWEEIDPSVGRVMTYLYDNDTVHISNQGAHACGLPNVTQLRTDLKWLIDQGIAAATIHDGKQVAFLTPRGEDIIDGNG